MNKPMTEHENTIAIIRKDYEEKIATWFLQNRDRHIKRADDYSSYQDMFERYTTLQLRAVCRLIDRGLADLTIQLCDPTNYAGVTFAGMFAGIETDGHTHT